MTWSDSSWRFACGDVLIFCLYPFQSKKWRSNTFHERFGKVFQVMDDLCLDFLWSANPWHNLLKINNSCVIFLSKLQHFQIKSRNQNSHKDHEFSKMFNNPPRVVIWQIPGQSNRTLNSCFRRKDELCIERTRQGWNRKGSNF